MPSRSLTAGASAPQTASNVSERGDKEADASGEDLPRSRGVLEAGECLAIEQPEEWLIGRRYPDMEELQRVALTLTRARHAHASG
jgi:hypothetical protein